ncbi:UDP-2-acetamido-2,6-beta-L-arabino-hexul-4-ose reductase [Shewanella gelidii]|uniref:UDP-2-acetamido-2,6-dideoxy-beta-L-talose 4-dehydrogenase n=1 Tax=Shewanella gelidii TaxID=1642821 RepID=A0A917JIT7_9GAMM|nr:NAD-dependent epimerase/dehydratase family protein [Shewanella gelidii]MCL1096423.1 NAD-dependent epimerase/dehydratase family protein [Shewanella gelidii]GGI67295.1 UDP-2-acetamido-2,6-dideoxy-beta-L-talose 4-dehydrogenase [Shewanella gelidii]
MKILVTGAEGFIGKNLCFQLVESGFDDLLKIDRDNSKDDLDNALKVADFIFHLAGVNRPKNESEFREGNANLTSYIVAKLQEFGRKTPILLTSSIQAERDNAYGVSKAEAEKSVNNYSSKTQAKVFVYRLPNVFGKWCRPNYNSVVATFCHNVANGLRLTINDPSAKINLVYIDTVCEHFISHLNADKPSGEQSISPVYPTTVGEIADALESFKSSKEYLITENVGNGFLRALYSTYISYYSPDQFSYNVPSYVDPRGTFCELLKTKESGQFSYFTAHPGVTRGGHYHHTKNEKFLVIKGKAKFRFEHIATGERYELDVEGEECRVVETVPGWTHDVTNIGEEELIVMLWANEIFDREKPDTIAKPL